MRALFSDALNAFSQVSQRPQTRTTDSERILSTLSDSSNLYIDVLKCVGEFRTTFRTIPAFVRLVRKP
jgi:hypothetical protein